MEIHRVPDRLPHIHPYEPTGYFEFRPDGTMLWYDYIVEERSFEGKFWIEPTETLSNIYNPTRERKVWILNIECDEIGHCHSFYLIFYSQNRMGLMVARIMPQFWTTNIFERKK